VQGRGANEIFRGARSYFKLVPKVEQVKRGRRRGTASSLPGESARSRSHGQRDGNEQKSRISRRASHSKTGDTVGQAADTKSKWFRTIHREEHLRLPRV